MAARIRRRLLSGQPLPLLGDEVGEYRSEEPDEEGGEEQSDEVGAARGGGRRKRAGGGGHDRAHTYGTRRKRIRKRYDEFVMEEDGHADAAASGQRSGEKGGDHNQKENVHAELWKRGDPARNGQAAEGLEALGRGGTRQAAPGTLRSRPRGVTTQYQASPLPAVAPVVSSFDDEIDMRAASLRPRRAMTKTLRIDMRPTLEGGDPIVTQSVVMNVTRAGDCKSLTFTCPFSTETATDDATVAADADTLNVSLASTSHSKCTRIGEEYQADLPELLPLSKPPEGLPSELPLARDEEYLPLLQTHRSMELEYLKQQTGRVIVALLPPSTSRSGRKHIGMPEVIIADPTLRNLALRICHGEPNNSCYMARHYSQSLCPRTCITLRTFTLTTAGDESETISSSDGLTVPSLQLIAETGETFNCDLWECNFCASDGSSSDEEDIFVGEPRVSFVMSDRYSGIPCKVCGDDMRRCPHTTFVQVNDGVQVCVAFLSCLTSIDSSLF